VVVTRAGVRHTIVTPLGPIELAPDARVTVRSSSVPPALYIDVMAGEARIAGETLRAGDRRELGDFAARRRLGPRVSVRILQLDDSRLYRAGQREVRARHTMAKTSSAGS